ncbi:MAG: chemotaxis protein CheD [Phenylobacterium sp.]
MTVIDPPAPASRAIKIHVVQGEHCVSADPHASLSSVLGSCVAACLYDPERGVGGMNHFLLASGDGQEAMRYGAYAMEVLINDLLKLGASRDRLQAKLFGGAKIMDRLNDIGAENAIFAREFLATEGIPLVSESLGGRRARRIEFWPVGGRARQREVDQFVEQLPAGKAPRQVVEDGIELF